MWNNVTNKRESTQKKQRNIKAEKQSEVNNYFEFKYWLYEEN